MQPSSSCRFSNDMYGHHVQWICRTVLRMFEYLSFGLFPLLPPRLHNFVNHNNASSALHKAFKHSV